MFRRFHTVLLLLFFSSRSLSLRMSGPSGGFQAPRGRASQKSSGASSGQAATLASPSTVPRSPLRGARTPNIFAAFAEDGKEAEDVPVATGATFPVSSPFYSNWFSKNMPAGKLSDLPLEPLFPFLPSGNGSLLREALGFQSFVDSGRGAPDSAYTGPMDAVLSQLRLRQDFDVNMFKVSSFLMMVLVRSML